MIEDRAQGHTDSDEGHSDYVGYIVLYPLLLILIFYSLRLKFGIIGSVAVDIGFLGHKNRDQFRGLSNDFLRLQDGTALHKHISNICIDFFALNEKLINKIHFNLFLNTKVFFYSNLFSSLRYYDYSYLLIQTSISI